MARRGEIAQKKANGPARKPPASVCGFNERQYIFLNVQPGAAPLQSGTIRGVTLKEQLGMFFLINSMFHVDVDK